MSTRLSMRMTCALLAGVAATVGFATPVVAQSSDLSSSFSKPSKPEAPKPSEKPAEKPTSEAPTPPAPDANKQSEAVLGKGYKATTKCEGRDVMLTVEFTAPEPAFYHVALHDMYNLQEKPLVVVDRWVNKDEKVTFKGVAPQRHPLALVSTRVEQYNYSPLISTDSLGAGPCVYPGKEL